MADGVASDGTRECFRFGPFFLDAAAFELRQLSVLVPLQPKVMDVLLHLVRNHERTVSRDELLDTVWPNEVVTEDSINHSVMEARRALGDSGRDQRLIKTVRGRGFRFVGRLEEPEERDDQPGPQAGAGAAELPFFVGRSGELAQLDSLLELALAGRGRLVLLSGDAGIGKTTLAERIVQRARGSGARGLVARGHAERGAPPYWAWIRILREYAQHVSLDELREDLGAGLPEMTRLLPGLAQRLGDPGDPPPLPPEQERFRLLESLTQFLVRAAARKPLLLLLDDLHDSDADSLTALGYLARQVEDAPLLVIGTLRADEAPHGPLADALSRLLSERTALTIPVTGLSQEDVATLLKRLDDADPSQARAHEIHERTQGNPFFVQELVRHIGAAESGPLPVGIREVLRRRFDRLSEAARGLLEAAAVLGPVADVRSLEQASGLAGETLHRLLAELRNAQVLEPVPDRAGWHRFCHPLLGEVLYGELPLNRQLALHRHVGKVLEERKRSGGRIRLADIAHHFTRAAPLGDADKAVRYGVAAAAESERALAFHDAAHRYQEALAALELDTSPSLETRCELELHAARTWSSAGVLGASRSAAERAVAAARELGDPVRLARAALGSWPVTFRSGFAGGDDSRITLLQDAVGGLEEPELASAGTEDLRAQLLSRLALARYWSGGADSSRSVADDAHELAMSGGDPRTLGYAHFARYVTRLEPGLEDGRLEDVRKLMETAEQQQEGDLLVVAGAHELSELLQRGDAADFERASLAHQRTVERLRHPRGTYELEILRAYFDADLEHAEARSRACRAHGLRAGDPNAATAHSIRLWQIRREQDRLVELPPSADRIPEDPRVATWLAPQVFILLAHGREADARAGFDALTRIARTRHPTEYTWLPFLFWLAELSGLLEDPVAASASRERLAPLAERHAVVVQVTAYLGPVHHALGICERVLGNADAAVDHLDRAVDACDALAAVPAAAAARLESARALRLREGPGDAARASQRAGEACQHAGERGLARLQREASEFLAS